MSVEIRTERLILRERTLADFDAYAAMWADPVVARHFPSGPLSREDSWLRFGRCVGLWTLMGYGPFAVIEKATGRFIGDIGAADYGRELDPPAPPCPEVGWALAASTHGKGYATEAVNAALAWAEAERGFSAFFCIIDPGNGPSIAVAERCGFRKTGQARHRGLMLDVLERRRA